MRNVQWLEADLWIIAQGIGGLLALIIGGVMLAEGAINDLARYTQHIEFINLQVSKMGVYTFYFFGESIHLHSLLQIGKIALLGRKLHIEVEGVSLVINTLPVFDLRDFFGLLHTWIMVVKQGIVVLVSDAGSWLMKGYMMIADYVCAFFGIW